MSTTRLYQIYDRAAQLAVGPIVRAKNSTVALRMFHGACADPKTDLAAHPADYELLYLGDQDDDTATIDGLLEPDIIGTGKGWIRLQQERDNLTEK